jgi:hypothetical protein
MEAVIKLKPEELTSGILSKIKKMIGKRNNMEVIITVRDSNEEYLATLDRSIHELETDKDTTTFAMEDFLEYPSEKPKK